MCVCVVCGVVVRWLLVVVCRFMMCVAVCLLVVECCW